MKFFQDMYVSEAVASHTDELIAKIKQNSVVKGLYLIVLAENSENLLEIIASREIVKPMYSKRELWIVGLAGGRKDALQLVEHMIGQMYEQTGTFDIRTYFQIEEDVRWK